MHKFKFSVMSLAVYLKYAISAYKGCHTPLRILLPLLEQLAYQRSKPEKLWVCSAMGADQNSKRELDMYVAWKDWVKEKLEKGEYTMNTVFTPGWEEGAYF